MGVADEAGLSHLRAVALDFVVMHFDAVAKTGAWAGLPRACADAVAAEVLTLLSTSVCFCLLSQYLVGPKLEHILR